MATVQAEEDGGVIVMTERAATADAITLEPPLSTAGMTTLFATRTGKETTRTMLILRRSVPNGNVFVMRRAPRCRPLKFRPRELWV